MAKRQPPKRLFKNRDRVSSYESERSRSPSKLMKRMAGAHEDVLQNIEFALVNRHREDPGIDDRAVDEALRCSLNDTEPSDARVADLVGALEAIRQFREDISDDVWHDGLRVVRDSVHRHSRLRRGETGYLAFAGQYV
jgi:uncharacterized alpha-E superfamily protein